MNQYPEGKKAEMLKALELSLGIVTTACKKVGIERRTHYNWLKNDPVYRASVNDVEEEAVDLSESKLFEKIMGVKVLVDKNNPESGAYQVPPSDRAIIFHLKAKGKKRGYNDRTEPVVQPKKLGLDLYEESVFEE